MEFILFANLYHGSSRQGETHATRLPRPGVMPRVDM